MSEQHATEKTELYAFTYEQYLKDANEWRPNYGMLRAATIEEAFTAYGEMLQTAGTITRKMTCGIIWDMTREVQRIQDYYAKSGYSKGDDRFSFRKEDYCIAISPDGLKALSITALGLHIDDFTPKKRAKRAKEQAE